MTLDALHTTWAADAQLDFSRPDAELRNIPLLHSKYWQIYTSERQRWVLVKQEYDALKRAKTDWLLGRLSDEEIKERGWAPQQLHILRQDVESYLSADAELSMLSGKLENQKTKLDFLEDIVKNINARNFILKNYIEYLKFSQGSL
jgi:hypothetical protein